VRIYAVVMHKYEPIKTGIIGARGYAGLELARLLLRHPRVKLASCFASDSPFALTDYLCDRGAESVPILPLSGLDETLKNLDVVFLATPPEISAKWAPKILNAGKDVIDLSGAFRLKMGNSEQCVTAYRKWYQMEHLNTELISRSIYGLSPWNHKQLPSETALIANPGCFATAVLMAILPLLSKELIDPHSIVIDAKSGASGAGRKATENLLFNEVEGDCIPYRIGSHAHLPEIQVHVEAISQMTIHPFFTTSLLPVRRGIIAGIYARLKGSDTAKESAKKINETFMSAYQEYPLVRFGDLSELQPHLQAQALSLKKISGTPKTHIFFKVVDDKIYLFSLIDNLLKGAASQAVENLNWLNHLPVDTGLTGLDGVL